MHGDGGGGGGPAGGLPGTPTEIPGRFSREKTGFLPPIDPGAYESGRRGRRHSRAAIVFIVAFAVLFIVIITMGIMH